MCFLENFIFLPCHATCEILTRDWTQALGNERLSPDLWTAREFPGISTQDTISCKWDCAEFVFLWLAYLFCNNVLGASLVAQMVKKLPTMQETWVQCRRPGFNALEKGMETHSSILAWRIPWTDETGSLQFMGSQRVGHNWATNTFTFSVFKVHLCCI